MILKFIFDRVMALLGLVFLSPILLLTAIVVRIDLPGEPVLFRQERVGKGGRLFTLVKFRTMFPGHGGDSISVSGESRITPLGAFLRRYKLNELPELWNVLKGDMSFVGPRPGICRPAARSRPGNPASAPRHHGSGNPEIPQRRRAPCRSR